jgi:hypothetical protein
MRHGKILVTETYSFYTDLKSRRNRRFRGNYMANERLGVPLSPEGSEAVPREKQENDKEPGFGWVLTDASRRAIESVEDNLRTAEQRTGSVILR